MKRNEWLHSENQSLIIVVFKFSDNQNQMAPPNLQIILYNDQYVRALTIEVFLTQIKQVGNC